MKILNKILAYFPITLVETRASFNLKNLIEFVFQIYKNIPHELNKTWRIKILRHNKIMRQIMNQLTLQFWKTTNPNN